jgi:lipopolysaccharide/colanic/teichoic acid biosynthesis glycosyltransferase
MTAAVTNDASSADDQAELQGERANIRAPGPQSPTSPVRVGLSLQARATKRSLDIVGAAVGLLVLAPAIIAVWTVVAIEGRRSPLFFQTRVGRGGRPIRVCKFRSMHRDAEQRLHEDESLYRRYVDNGFKLPEAEDPRITRLGRFLRKSSLDELPQFWCVLRGDMSLVGPRPVLPNELEHLYGDRSHYYLAIKPGLTGLWQVNGRSTVRHGDRAELDFRYLETWSLAGDIRIVLATVPAVLGRHGAH